MNTIKFIKFDSLVSVMNKIKFSFLILSIFNVRAITVIQVSVDYLLQYFCIAFKFTDKNITFLI